MNDSVIEAQLILGRHAELHALGGECQTLMFIQEVFGMGSSLDEVKVREILLRMRRTDQTGVYPTPDFGPRPKERVSPKAGPTE